MRRDLLSYAASYFLTPAFIVTVSVCVLAVLLLFAVCGLVVIGGRTCLTVFCMGYRDVKAAAGLAACSYLAMMVNVFRAMAFWLGIGAVAMGVDNDTIFMVLHLIGGIGSFVILIACACERWKQDARIYRQLAGLDIHVAWMVAMDIVLYGIGIRGFRLCFLLM